MEISEQAQNIHRWKPNMHWQWINVLRYWSNSIQRGVDNYEEKVMFFFLIYLRALVRPAYKHSLNASVYSSQQAAAGDGRKWWVRACFLFALVHSSDAEVLYSMFCGTILWSIMQTLSPVAISCDLRYRLIYVLLGARPWSAMFCFTRDSLIIRPTAPRLGNPLLTCPSQDHGQWMLCILLLLGGRK